MQINKLKTDTQDSHNATDSEIHKQIREVIRARVGHTRYEL